MGPFPTSSKGNRYVLVIGNTFTKWIEAYAIPDQTANTVAEVVVKEFIARFGTPLEIHTDQGKNFESTLFQDICKLLEISKTRTTPYPPASNGMIERFNRTLVDMISLFVDKKQLNWDENILLLMYHSRDHRFLSQLSHAGTRGTHGNRGRARDRPSGRRPRPPFTSRARRRHCSEYDRSVTHTCSKEKHWRGKRKTEKELQCEAFSKQFQPRRSSLLPRLHKTKGTFA